MGRIHTAHTERPASREDAAYTGRFSETAPAKSQEQLERQRLLYFKTRHTCNPFRHCCVLLYRRAKLQCRRQGMDQADEQLRALLATDLDYHFSQLVMLYQQRLYSFALRLEGHPQDAEDIVQETFLRSYHVLKSYPASKVGVLQLRGWLYKIALNVIRNRQRKPQHPSISLGISEDDPALEIEDPSFGPDEEAYWHEWRRELERHLSTLAERYRVAVTLYYFEDLSYGEVAELLNQPIGTVKANIHRALRMLHKALDTQANGVR